MNPKVQASGSNASELFGSNRMWGLKELSEAQPISYFPETVGWIYLLIFFLLVLLGIGIKLYLNWKKKVYLRDATKLLIDIQNNTGKSSTIPFILKSVALSEGKRKEIASLRSTHWTDWLNSQLNKPVFNENDSRLLDELPYKSEMEMEQNKEETAVLIAKCLFWVSKHHA